MYHLEFKPLAQEQLKKLARYDPGMAKDVSAKIAWLAENADAISHEQLKGQEECSLHCGQYRIPYLIDWTNQTIIITDVDKHDATYRRLKRK